jgi:hypothetical protein
MSIDSVTSPVFVVIPVFNDWESCRLLLDEASQNCSTAFFRRLRFCWVNDGSSDPAPKDLLRSGMQDQHIELTRNVGHQKAIALGIASISQDFPGHAIMVMDGDGEDRPGDLEKLFEASGKHSSIVFARRTRRHEGFFFRFFYQLYKLIFFILTGKKIAFGNFSCIPANLAARVAHVSEIWNHYSGGIIKSRIPFASIPLERGRRLAGKSKMNFTGLVLHGLSAVAIYADYMAVRLVLFCFFLVVFSLLSIVLVAVVKFFTPFASPGWATTVITGFTSIIMQSFLVSLLLLFVVLMYRTQKLFIPAKDFRDYIAGTETD